MSEKGEEPPPPSSGAVPSGPVHPTVGAQPATEPAAATDAAAAPAAGGYYPVATNVVSPATTATANQGILVVGPGNVGQRPASQSLMILAIVATICFCPLTGAFAMYFAYESDQQFYCGDMDGAKRKAKLSKHLSLASFVLCGVLALICVTIQVVLSIVFFKDDHPED